MVQNIPEPRGRPRSLDEAKALEKATQVFRSMGYDGLTIGDLVAAMDFNRGLTMRARLGATRRTLLKDADEAVDLSG